MQFPALSLGAVGLVGLLASPAAAFFKLPCPGPLVQERADPVVSPGKTSGHVHTILGGNGFGLSMTYDDARASTCTSCKVSADKSNYWIPTLYFRNENGTFTSVDQVGGALIYYEQRMDQGKDEKSLIPFPPGFRMVAGDPFARSFSDSLEAKAINYACLYNGKKQTNGFPNENCPGGLRTQIFFPSCWNGKDLDSADHKSHMAYPSGTDHGDCPDGFNSRFISIFYEVLWSIDPFKDQWNGRDFPFVLSTGDPTGFGFHGDFVNGWDTEVLENAIHNCRDGNHAYDHNGAIEYCQPLLPLISDDEARQCKQKPVVDEQVTGLLPALPGCNPVQSGPGVALTKPVCDAVSPAASSPKEVNTSPAASSPKEANTSPAASSPKEVTTSTAAKPKTRKPRHSRHKKHAAAAKQT